MSTFDDVKTIIINETKRSDKATLILTYLYETAEEILATYNSLIPLRDEHEFTVSADTYDYNLQTFIDATDMNPFIKRMMMELEKTSHYSQPVYFNEENFKERHGDEIVTPTFTGIPVDWTLINTTVRFAPIPDDTYTARLMFFRDQTLSPGTTILFPTLEVLKSGAKMRMYRDMGMGQRAQMYGTDFARLMENLLKRQSNQDDVLIQKGYY